MDVTLTNVLQGVRQYFQGIPSSSNPGVRNSNLTESHCGIPSSSNQDVPPSDQYWPSHINTSSRLQSRNDSPVRQSVPHITANNQSQLQYSRERVEPSIPHYKKPFIEKNEAPQEQQFQFRHTRMPRMDHCEQEQAQQRLFLQHGQQHQPQANNQQLYFQHQAKHHKQKPNYQYLQASGEQEYQYKRAHRAEQPQLAPSSVNSQISQYNQPHAKPTSQFYLEGSSSTNNSLQDPVIYPVSSERQSTSCYSTELKNYSWQGSFPTKNSAESYPISKNIYSNNLSVDEDRVCDASYPTTIQTSHHSEIPPKNSAIPAHKYEPTVSLPSMPQINRSNRESIISPVNICRTRDFTVLQRDLSYNQNLNHENTGSIIKLNVQSQPVLSEANYELPQFHHQYEAPSGVHDGFDSKVNNNIYASKNPNGFFSNQRNNINNPNSTSTQTSNHGQVNCYTPTYTYNKNPVRKESPLDLSLRTVKTTADSTLNEADNDVIFKGSHNQSNLKVTKNYPQFNVELFERNLTQRSSQLPNATGTRYEFKANSIVTNQSPVTKYSTGIDKKTFPYQSENFSHPLYTKNIRYPPDKSSPTLIQSNPQKNIQSQRVPSKFNRGVTSVITDQSSSSTSNIKRRSSNTPECALLNKIPKLVDPWRKSIDMQIDERLSSYSKQRQNKSIDNVFNSASYYPTNEERSHGGIYSQNCIKEINSAPCTVQENRQYSNNTVINSLTSGLVGSSPPSNIKMQTNSFYGADKHVLNILRSSLEIKGKRKMEQKKTQENFCGRFHNEKVKSPAIDMTANPSTEVKTTNSSDLVTPITKENSNLISLPIPRDVETVIIQSKNVNTVTESVEVQDNFAEVLAARIRTKGELKQGGCATDFHNLIDINEEDIKHKTFSSTDLSEPVSLKTHQNISNRKGIFSSKSEEGTSNRIPHRNKSEIRSSSETSVFDFPDSESDHEGKESLETMRKCRKPKNDLPIDIKTVESTHSDENNFMKVCDDFVLQLKGGFKRKTKRKNILDSKLLEESDTSQNQLDCNDFQQGAISEKDVIDDETEIINTIINESEEQNEANNNMISSDKNGAEITVSANESTDPNEIEKTTIESIKIDNGETEMYRKLQNEAVVKEEKFQNNESKDSHENNNLEKDVPIEPNKGNNNIVKDNLTKTQNSSAISVIRPSKKPLFGDQSYFYPGWEEGVYKYKKSLRIPPTLIQISRPPQFHRLSTSLPDLDPYSQSPMVFSPNDNEQMSKLTQTKSESLESDNESDYNYNVFGKKTNYDSESSASVISSPNSTKELSILDKLLEKYGRNRERKYRRNEMRQRRLDESNKIIPSTSLEMKDGMQKKKSSEMKPDSRLQDCKKSTSTLKDNFAKSPERLEDLNDNLTSVILKARTRKETRILKQRATIKEIFGEERPASAPPSTVLNYLNFKKGIFEEDNCLGNLVIKLEKRDDMIDRIMQKQKKIQSDDEHSHNNKNLTLIDTDKITTEAIESELESLDESVFRKYSNERFETRSVDEYENVSRGRKRNRSGKIRRKFSSGFDYIRKKKKVKKEIVKNYFPSKKEKIYVSEKVPESIHDIHKEIKTWVLNKGIGETHLHRAARLGYTDVTAYCLEKLNCNPSPKDNAGYTPLHEACARGHLEIAKLLLMYGANPSESAQGGVRPLHEACENGYVELTRLLLSYGADPNLVTYSGLTPLALTNDDRTKKFLMNHLNDIEGEPSSPWITFGPASFFDPVETDGFNMLENVPDDDAVLVEEDSQFEFEEADKLLPNFYTLQNEPRSDRWILLQDLSSLLRVKSKDALLKQITHPSTSHYKTVFKEMKMTDFLEQAQCCQFLNLGEKINSRASKISLVKYTKKLKELLNIETVTITR